jgi:4-amino-4-deoxy-L-arabinose transferase-like glycosyltransferase
MLRSLRTHGWLLGVLAIAAFVMLFRLGDRPVENWDEGIHGAVSIDMVERGDWVTPWYAGGTYFRKPPLKLWMSAALFEAFGMNAWTLRLPSAIAGILTALLTAWWMWEWRRNRLEAFLAGTIVAIMRPIFFHAFRTGEMDGLLTLFTTATLYCWWRATRAVTHRAGNEFLISNSKFLIKSQVQMTKWMALVGLFLGLAVMTKSAAGLLPLPIIAADYLLHRRWRIISVHCFLLPASCFLLVAAPWHLAMTWLHGTTFWSDYVGWHVVKRATEAIHNPTADTWWYFPTLLRKFSPFSWWLVPAILFQFILSPDALSGRRISQVRSASAQGTEVRIGEILRRFTPQDKLETLLLLWLLITLALFTIAKTKFDWYLLPLYPAAAMLLARFLVAARDVARDRMTAVLHLVALAIAVLALPSLYPDGSTLDRAVAQVYAPFGHPIVLAAVTVAGVVGVVVAIHRRWGATVAGRVAQVLVLVLVLVPSAVVTASHLLRTPPEGPFQAIAAAVKGSGGHLVSYGMDYKQHPAGYFILRAALSGDVRILDGRRRDIPRTLSMLRERERGFLLTQNETELPEELRAAVADPQIFERFTLWTRR